ncbi:hypothetical protein RF644_10050 [Kocuria sp. CPCC 205258]|uniref:hypothetical protein n=1 Tax=Kocuria sp. CPCC 205258 TaxID=3073552 RepID=UPI0034D3FB2D
MIVPDGDSLIWRHIWYRGWRGNGTLSALVMRPAGQSSIKLRRTFATMLKSIMIQISNAYKNVSVLKLESSISNNNNINSVPDPISFKPSEFELESIWPSTSRTREIEWIGVVGALTCRKNIPLVLESALNVNRHRIGIVLAGKLDESLKAEVQTLLQKMERRRIQTVLLDQPLTDGQLDAILSRLKIVVLAHSNEGPSGILGKAVEAGTFVVAAGAHSLRDDCKILSKSSAWSPLSAPDISESIRIGLEHRQVTPRSLNTECKFAEGLFLSYTKNN